MPSAATLTTTPPSIRRLRKRALVIGINYRGTADQLTGCANDARAITTALPRILGYQADEIVTLVDDDATRAAMPTRAAIEEQMEALLQATLDDATVREVFVSFSGHGMSLDDHDPNGHGEEEDGRDEAIVPVDFATAGVIRDDQIAQWLARFPAHCHVFCLFDACHSGTMGDLPLAYHHEVVPGRRRRVRRYRRVRVNGHLRWRRVYEWITSPPTLRRRETRAPQADQAPVPAAHVVTLSGCRDPQTSAEMPLLFGEQPQDVAPDNVPWGGALTGAFLHVAHSARHTGASLSCFDLCHDVHDAIRNATTLTDQVPTLCTSAPIRGDTLFLPDTRSRAHCCVIT